MHQRFHNAEKKRDKQRNDLQKCPVCERMFKKQSFPEHYAECNRKAKNECEYQLQGNKMKIQKISKQSLFFQIWSVTCALSRHSVKQDSTSTERGITQKMVASNMLVRFAQKSFSLLTGEMPTSPCTLKRRTLCVISALPDSLPMCTSESTKSGIKNSTDLSAESVYKSSRTRATPTDTSWFTLIYHATSVLNVEKRL